MQCVRIAEQVYHILNCNASINLQFCSKICAQRILHVFLGCMDAVYALTHAL